jgi:KTSC domain
MAKLIPVASSMIQAVGYDPKTRILEVVFNSGQIYCYEDVPPNVYKELMAADSKGRYMQSEILGVYADYPVSGRRRR